MPQPKRKPGRPKGICLTPVDHEILEGLQESEFITHSEIQKIYLPTKHPRFIWKKMKRLTRAGLVRESRGDRNTLLGWYLPGQGDKKRQEMELAVTSEKLSSLAHRIAGLPKEVPIESFYEESKNSEN